MQDAPVVELDTIAPSDGAGLGSSPSGRTKQKPLCAPTHNGFCL